MTVKTRLEHAVENLTDAEKAAMLAGLKNPNEFGVTRVRTGGFYLKVDDQKLACPLTLMYLQLGYLLASALNGEFDGQLDNIFKSNPDREDAWQEFYKALDISALAIGDREILGRLMEYLQPQEQGE